VPDRLVAGLPTGCTLWCKVVPSRHAKSDWYATYAAEWKGRPKNAAGSSGKRKHQHRNLTKEEGDTDAKWTTVGPKQARQRKDEVPPRTVKTRLGGNKRKKQQPKRFVVTLV
jgi:hypothetical protein